MIEQQNLSFGTVQAGIVYNKMRLHNDRKMFEKIYIKR